MPWMYFQCLRSSCQLYLAYNATFMNMFFVLGSGAIMVECKPRLVQFGTTVSKATRSMAADFLMVRMYDKEHAFDFGRSRCRRSGDGILVNRIAAKPTTAARWWRPRPVALQSSLGMSRKRRFTESTLFLPTRITPRCRSRATFSFPNLIEPKHWDRFLSGAAMCFFPKRGLHRRC